MPPARMFTLSSTAFAMLAFAGNSLLCRLALRPHAIDAASFALVRIAAGAAVLVLVVRLRIGTRGRSGGSWGAACALAAYAVLFAFAYVALDAGTGTLLLFGAVQVTMLGAGLRRGERPPLRTWCGLAAAVVGLVVLVTNGRAAAGGTWSAWSVAAMVGAGVAWGLYSLRGRGTADPVAATAGNFARALPVTALALLLPAVGARHLEPRGVVLAAVSGAVTSGLGYVVWYAALRSLSATAASIVQLSVPVLAACGGVLLLGEAVTLRLAVAAALVLGGVAFALGLGRRANKG